MSLSMFKSASVLVLLALTSACTAISTQSSQDPSLDLSAYSTYKIESKSKLPPHLSRRIEQALQNRLSTAGLSASNSPDLLVNFYTIVHDELQVTESSTPTLVTFRRGYAVWNTYETDVRHVTEGTLLVDVMDSHAKKLVWEGSAHGLVSRGNVERTGRKIEQAVAKMFDSFPNKNGQEQ